MAAPIILISFMLTALLIYLISFAFTNKKVPLSEKLSEVLNGNERLCSLMIFNAKNKSYSMVHDHFDAVYGCFLQIKEDKVYVFLNLERKIIITSNYVRLLKALKEEGFPLKGLHLKLCDYTIEWCKKVLEHEGIDEESKRYVKDIIRNLTFEVVPLMNINDFEQSSEH